ncbi:MAG: threonyl-tRNA synthetase, partial [Frankiaceae bacterium]|nr:threonyl-tRNA synthetase [Frankiaceae bacterium]
MADLRLTVDGSPQVVAAGTSIGDVFRDLAVSNAIAARGPDGALRDLAWVPDDGDVVESVPLASPEGLSIVRHSTAHVLAQAVQRHFPSARLGIGPPIDNGFYYDFDVDRPFTPEDLELLEATMREIVAEGQRFARRVVADDDARAELANEPYKLELIGLKGGAAGEADGADVEVGGAELTIYDNFHPDGSLAWKDLCRGPHVPLTSDIPAFRLMRSAAAYWRG